MPTHEHNFAEFELSDIFLYPMPRRRVRRVYYRGYLCECGEVGYQVPA